MKLVFCGAKLASTTCHNPCLPLRLTWLLSEPTHLLSPYRFTPGTSGALSETASSSAYGAQSCAAPSADSTSQLGQEVQSEAIGQLPDHEIRLPPHTPCLVLTCPTNRISGETIGLQG